MKYWKRILPLVLMLLLLPLSAKAAGQIDLSCSNSLTICCICGVEPVADMPISGYLVAKVDATGTLTVTSQFAAYAEVLPTGRNDSAWQTLAARMVEELPADACPKFTGRTDATGNYTVKNMTMGLYLITGDRVKSGENFYEICPFFGMIPEPNGGNDWNYHVIANVKPSQTPDMEEYTVIKKWIDPCNKDHQPEKISLRILQDGELYETITLPRDGKWSYQWVAEAGHTWLVEEDWLSGYQKPEITRKGFVFTVINRCDDPKLPQTGQLWWPVPILLCCGLVLIAAGVARRKGKQNER